jgi:H+/Cl- antiporter ClcA
MLKIKHYLNIIYNSILIKWIVISILIGIIAGTTSAILLNTNDFLTELREQYHFLIYFLPIGGLIIGLIYKYYGQDSFKGNNIPYQYVNSGKGKIPLRMGPIVFICTFITHIFGGSTGREGAAIQMGGSISEGMNKLFKINQREKKTFIITGIAAGFGSAFGAPLAGTIFGMEVPTTGKIRYEALIPATIASFVGHYMAMAWGVNHEHNIIKALPETGLLNIAKVILVAMLFGLASILYSILRHGIEDFCNKYLKDYALRAMAGGIVILILVYLVGTREYLGRSLPMLENAFEGNVPMFAFLGGIIFTAVTMGTGFRGGEAIPLFFIGATLGSTLSPIVNLPVSFLAALGLIGVFCGGVNTPLAAFVFSVEHFDGIGVVYFFIVCIVSYLVSGKYGIYADQKFEGPKKIMFNISNQDTVNSIRKRVYSSASN